MIPMKLIFISMVLCILFKNSRLINKVVYIMIQNYLSCIKIRIFILYLWVIIPMLLLVILLLKRIYLGNVLYVKVFRSKLIICIWNVLVEQNIVFLALTIFWIKLVITVLILESVTLFVKIKKLFHIL